MLTLTLSPWPQGRALMEWYNALSGVTKETTIGFTRIPSSHALCKYNEIDLQRGKETNHRLHLGVAELGCLLRSARISCAGRCCKGCAVTVGGVTASSSWSQGLWAVLPVLLVY